MKQTKRFVALSLAVLMVFCSFATIFAFANEAAKRAKGDVNGNGEIDSMDYVLTKRAYFGTYKLSAEQFEAADISGNGKIESMDYVYLKRMYFGTYEVPETPVDPSEPSDEPSEDPSTSEEPSEDPSASEDPSVPTGDDPSEDPSTSEDPSVPTGDQPEDPHECVGTGDWIYDDDNHWKLCECGEKADFAAHIPGEEVEEQERTEEQAGIYATYCTECGKELDRYELPAYIAPLNNKVVAAFDPEAWGDYTDGAVQNFIFTADYTEAAPGFSWWIMVSFKPVEGETGVYEVVTVRPANGITEPLAIPEGGFVWTAHCAPAAGSNGAWGLSFMSALSAGAKVEFTGLDIANKTAAEDANATVMPTETENNLALGKDDGVNGYVDSQGQWPCSYNANLTDGVAASALSYDKDVWFGSNLIRSPKLTSSTGSVSASSSAMYCFNSLILGSNSAVYSKNCSLLISSLALILA